MPLLQKRDDIDEVISFAIVHFDLPRPSVRGCFGDHPLCVSKLCLVDFEKADICAKVGQFRQAFGYGQGPATTGMAQ